MSLKVLQLVTTYQSLVSILDTKLRLLQKMSGVELHVASSFEDKSETRLPAGTYHKIPMARQVSPISDIVSIVLLLILIKKHKFDMIHTHTAKAGMVGAIAGWLAGVPVVHSYHGLPFFKGQPPWRKFFAKYGEAIISLIRSALLSQNKGDYDKIAGAWYTICPVYYSGNGIDPKGVNESARQNLDKVAGLFDSNRLHLLCVSRLEPVKMVAKVIETVRYLDTCGMPVECIIAGKGHLRKRLQNRVDALGLQQSIRILYSPYAHSLIAKCDALILASRKEGLPRAVLEAMALGKPVLATDVQGTRELLVHEETGILVPADSQDALNAAAKRLLSDKAIRDKYGKAGRTRAFTEYDTEGKTVDLWLRTYQEVLRAGKGSKARAAAALDSKRALFVSTVGFTIEAFLIPYIGLFQKRGYEVVALANWQYNWNRLPFTVRKVYCPFSRDAKSLLNVAALFRAVALLRRESFGMIYTHTPIASLVVRVAKMISGNPAPIIYEIHGLHVHDKGKVFSNALFRFVESSLARHTQKIITINKDDYSFAKRYFRTTKNFYSPGIGVDMEYYRAGESDRESIRSAYGVPQDVPVIITIADFIKRKRLDLCVEAAILLAQSKRTFKWILVGTGVLEHVIANLIQRKGLDSRIVCAGHQNDVRPFLAASDIFVLLSMQEGLPRSLLEAGAMGLPAVVSDIRGNRDLVESGVNSFLVPTDDPVSASARILELLDDTAKRKDLGLRLKADIASGFSLEKALAIHEKILFDS
jgi:glycosyltransferase involved in cell wall biosynthesis